MTKQAMQCIQQINQQCFFGAITAPIPIEYPEKKAKERERNPPNFMFFIFPVYIPLMSSLLLFIRLIWMNFVVVVVDIFHHYHHHFGHNKSRCFFSRIFFLSFSWKVFFFVFFCFVLEPGYGTNKQTIN